MHGSIPVALSVPQAGATSTAKSTTITARVREYPRNKAVTLGCIPTACFASSLFPSSSVGVLCYCRLSFLHLLGKVKSEK